MIAESEASQTILHATGAPATREFSPLQRVIVSLLLTAAVALTIYGFIAFDWSSRPKWAVDEVRSLIIALGIPCLVLVGGSWWRRWPMLGALVVAAALFVTYGPAVIAVLAFCALGFAAIGVLIFRIKLDSLESGLLAVILGYGLAGVVVGYTAQFRIHFDFTYGAVLAGSIFVARRELIGWLRQSWMRLDQPLLGHLGVRVVSNLGVGLAVVLSIALMLYSTTREGGHDGLVTHLYLTESLRLNGFFAFDQTLSPFVFMPKTAVWGLGVIDVIGGEYALRAAHAALLMITVALVSMRATGTMGRGGAGVLGATLLSAPLSLWISAHFFEETGTLVFVAATVVFFLRSNKSENYRAEDIAGLACLGMAVSSKAQILFLGLLGVAFVLRRITAIRSPAAVLTTVIGSAVFLVMAVGPYAHAFLATGNPLYPFVPGEVLDARWQRPLTIGAPLDMVFSTSNYMEAYPGAFAFHFIVLLGCTLASLALIKPKSISALAVASLAFAVVLASQTLYARYQVYAFPIYMLACAAIYPALAQIGRWILLGVLTVLVGMNWLFWPGVHVADFTLNQLTAPDLNSQVPPERRAFAALNDLLGRKTSVYVAGPRFMAGLAGTPHAASQAANKIDASGTVQEIARNLRNAEITHVIISEPMRNPLVLEACKIVCKEFPIGMSDFKIFAVDLSRASILADRLNAGELLGVDLSIEAARSAESVAAALPPTFEVVEGWGNRENWGWWSVAPNARVKLGPGFAGAALIKAKVQPFSPAGTQGVDVVALLDDVEVATWRFEAGSTGQVVEKTIKLGVPITAGAPSVLEFRFSHTYAPKDSVGGSDARQLALGLIAVTR